MRPNPRRASHGESAPARFRRGRPGDIPFIARKAAEWKLDHDRLIAKDFLIAEASNGDIIGFGRVKRYPSCFELGTVGVAPARRGEGLGGRIVRKLIEAFPSDDVWITTDLLDYFETFGFKVARRGPRELEKKIATACPGMGRPCCRIMSLSRRAALGRVRLARPGDAARCAAIYATYVRRTAVTFETEAPSAADFRKRIADTLKLAPWLVYERGGEILGYAYAGRHRDRAAYRWSVDAAIYLDARRKGEGVGRALYSTLLDCVKLQGFRNVYGGVTLPNPASVGLHESMGFKPIGVYRRVGFKLGVWHDVGWWGLALAENVARPKEPVPLSAALRSPALGQALRRRIAI